MGIISIIDNVTSYFVSDIKKQTGKGFFQTFTDKGNYGEFLSYKYLFMTPGKREFIHNCYLPTEKGTTEIDLLMIHETGLYVVESKNYSGWIFGDEKQKDWTQVLGGKKIKFFNPIRQNAGHIKALRSYFGEYQDLPIFSLVIFSERCELKKITLQNEDIIVIKRNQLKSVFKQQIKGKEKLPPMIMLDIYQRLLPLCKVDEAEKQLHIDRINEMKGLSACITEIADAPAPESIEMQPAEVAAVEVASISEQPTTESVPTVEPANELDICPRCGAKLVERKGKKGSFVGCGSFPKCRYTATIAEQPKTTEFPA